MGPIGHLLYMATPHRLGVIQIDLIHRNKYKETTNMGRQRHKPQIKLNEMEAINLSDIEFKIMVIRMFKEPSDNYSSTKSDIETMGKTSHK